MSGLFTYGNTYILSLKFPRVCRNSVLGHTLRHRPDRENIILFFLGMFNFGQSTDTPLDNTAYTPRDTSCLDRTLPPFAEKEGFDVMFAGQRCFSGEHDAEHFRTRHWRHLTVRHASGHGATRNLGGFRAAKQISGETISVP